MNELLTHDVMLDLLIVVYTQFMIMLIELSIVLSQEQKCLCKQDYHSPVKILGVNNYIM
jgi:hypothetical protein